MCAGLRTSGYCPCPPPVARDPHGLVSCSYSVRLAGGDIGRRSLTRQDGTRWTAAPAAAAAAACKNRDVGALLCDASRCRCSGLAAGGRVRRRARHVLRRSSRPACACVRPPPSTAALAVARLQAMGWRARRHGWAVRLRATLPTRLGAGRGGRGIDLVRQRWQLDWRCEGCCALAGLVLGWPRRRASASVTHGCTRTMSQPDPTCARRSLISTISASRSSASIITAPVSHVMPRPFSATCFWLGKFRARAGPSPRALLPQVDEHLEQRRLHVGLLVAIFLEQVDERVLDRRHRARARAESGRRHIAWHRVPRRAGRRTSRPSGHHWSSTSRRAAITTSAPFAARALSASRAVCSPFAPRHRCRWSSPSASPRRRPPAPPFPPPLLASCRRRRPHHRLCPRRGRRGSRGSLARRPECAAARRARSRRDGGVRATRVSRVSSYIHLDLQYRDRRAPPPCVRNANTSWQAHPCSTAPGTPAFEPRHCGRPSLPNRPRPAPNVPCHRAAQGRGARPPPAAAPPPPSRQPSPSGLLARRGARAPPQPKRQRRHRVGHETARHRRHRHPTASATAARLRRAQPRGERNRGPPPPPPRPPTRGHAAAPLAAPRRQQCVGRETRRRLFRILRFVLVARRPLSGAPICVRFADAATRSLPLPVPWRRRGALPHPSAPREALGPPPRGSRGSEDGVRFALWSLTCARH